MTRLNFDLIQGNEFANTYNWDFVLNARCVPEPVMTKLRTLYASYDPQPPEVQSFAGPEGIINTHCTTPTFPSSSAGFAEGSIRGHKIWQHAVREQGGTITLGLIDTADGLLGSLFEIWKNINWSNTQGAGYDKATLLPNLNGTPGIMIRQYNNNAQQGLKPTISHNMYWIAIESSEVGSLSADNGDLQTVDVTIKYGRYDRSTGSNLAGLRD